MLGGRGAKRTVGDRWPRVCVSLAEGRCDARVVDLVEWSSGVCRGLHVCVSLAEGMGVDLAEWSSVACWRRCGSAFLRNESHKVLTLRLIAVLLLVPKRLLWTVTVFLPKELLELCLPRERV